MTSKGRIVVLCVAAAAIALAGCGLTPIPDDEVAALAGAGTAGTGGDLTALAIFGGGAPKSYGVSQTIVVPGVGSLTYDYTIDYLDDTISVDPSGDTWDKLTLDGSAELVVNLPNYEANRTLDVSFAASEFNDDPNDNLVTLDGTSTAAGSATWTNPNTDATAGYTMNLTKTWTEVVIDDPSEPGWAGYPSSGTVQIAGSIERHRDDPSGVRTGSWSGSILITFDGDTTAAVDVNGSPYVLDLLTGEVTAAP